jgi:hypothetical protein
VWVDFLVDKVTDRAAQLFVFLGEDHFYCSPQIIVGLRRLGRAAQVELAKPNELFGSVAVVV